MLVPTAAVLICEMYTMYVCALEASCLMLTITYSNNGTQTATASIKHEASKAQTYIVYISQISTAAVGTSTGGPGK